MAIVARATTKEQEALRLVDKGSHWEVHLRKARYSYRGVSYQWCVLCPPGVKYHKPEGGYGYVLDKDTAIKLFNKKAHTKAYKGVKDDN